MITGSLCRAARALVEIDRAKLAERTGIERKAVELFERGIDVPDRAAVAALQTALEDLGAVFLPETASQGAGVRLKFSRSITERIANLESEGGRIASDDVP